MSSDVILTLSVARGKDLCIAAQIDRSLASIEADQDVAADPLVAYLFFSRFSSALRRSGYRNGYPVEISFAGSMRWLAKRSSSAIWPNTKRAANAGIGNTVGRDNTDPNVLVKSVLVTGRGATALTGPWIKSDFNMWWTAPTRS